ncbi:MAG: hypothetical protein IT583_05425 [Verrucomicrobia bacterium]|nr:hypothetical protein [Verrucomicrobiota bacterium]
MNLSRKIRWVLFTTLGVYTLLVAGVEYFFSPSAARYFLTDIVSTCPDYSHLPLYAINTSLSVFFLWTGAVLFLVTWRCLKLEEIGGREELFLVSQMIMFFYLGCDDRFLIHEGLSDHLGFKDWMFFGILGCLEAGTLVFWGRIFCRGRKAVLDIVLAGGFFSIMLVTDVMLPYEFPMHLSIEDLAKLWSTFFLFKFAWDTCSEKIDRLKGI